MPNNFVKIIGGKWRTRLLKFPSESVIKPTSNRIRETLFNWLAPIIPEAHCLDLFAGSGALGIEALSRGATWVGFVELSYRNASALSQQLNTLGANHCSSVYHQSYRQLTSQKVLGQSFEKRPIDVVFLDPPFHSDLLKEALHWLLKQSFIHPNTYFYIECEKDFDFSEEMMEPWQPLKQKYSGNVYYGLWTQKHIRS